MRCVLSVLLTAYAFAKYGFDLRSLPTKNKSAADVQPTFCSYFIRWVIFFDEVRTEARAGQNETRSILRQY